MDKNLKKIYRKTGIYVFLAVLTLIFLIVFIAQGQRTFSRKFSFYTIINDAQGLDNTSNVVFKGTDIGKIRNYRFNEERNIEVQFVIYSEYIDLIVKDSAIYKSVNPISGRASVDFLSGSIDGDILEEHSLIPSLDSEEGRRLLAERRISSPTDRLSSIIANISKFAENLNRDDNYDQGSFFRMMYHLAHTTETLNESLVSFNNIMLSLQKDHAESEGSLFRLTVNLADLAEEMQQSNSLLTKNLLNLDTLITNYSEPDDLLVKMIDPTEEKIFTPLNESLNNIAKNMEDINKLIGFLHYQTPEMAILMSEANKTLSELQRTLQGLNNNPLIRRGIKSEELPISGERIRIMGGE